MTVSRVGVFDTKDVMMLPPRKDCGLASIATKAVSKTRIFIFKY